MPLSRAPEMTVHPKWSYIKIRGRRNPRAEHSRLRLGAEENGVREFNLAAFALAHRGRIRLADSRDPERPRRFSRHFVQKFRVDAWTIKHANLAAFSRHGERLRRASFYANEDAAGAPSDAARHPSIKPFVG